MHISLKSGLARRAPIVLATVVLAVVWLSSLSASAQALTNPERHYEMVSPVYKEGYGVSETIAAEPAGESFAFTSLGGFEPAPSGGYYAKHHYLARRGPTGWTTEAIDPAFGGFVDFSANLEYALASGPLGPNVGVENRTAAESVFQLHATDTHESDTAESWEVFGGGEVILKRLDGGQVLTAEQSASADLCHLVLKSEAALLTGGDGPDSIYDFSRGCGGEPPSLRLIAVSNDPTTTLIDHDCEAGLGSGRTYLGPEQNEDLFNAVNADGSEMFFSASVVPEGSGCELDRQLFVRVGGGRTLELSRPFEAGKQFAGCAVGGVAGEVPCEGALTRPSAYFRGASEDGSKVFFTTTAPLLGTDEDAGNDLYMATIGCPGVEPSAGVGSCEPSQREVTALVPVSHDPVAKQAAEVQGVVRLAPDGSRIYFVARGELSEGPNAQGQTPAQGADNLYVYNTRTGQTAFVAELCSGPGRSGVAADTRCPGGLAEGGGDAVLWTENARTLTTWSGSQSTGDGAFLVFCSYGQLSPGDTDSAKDVYRYDAETGTLVRVSVGENDYDANGNNNAFDANLPSGGGGPQVYEEHELKTRAISEDGSRIVFETADRLSPAATNRRVNIYEWHEGSVSLVSSGASEENDSNETITPSGKDIFFTTSQGLVAQDTDGLPDVYDARLGEGFAAAPAERQPCSGDGCQGPLTNPAPLLVPGSVEQAPGGNFAAPAPAVTAKPKAKVKKKAESRKRARRKAKKSTRGSK
jgi:hypothetical protein